MNDNKSRDVLNDSTMFELLQDVIVGTSNIRKEVTIDYGRLLEECYTRDFHNEVIIGLGRSFTKNGYLTNKQIAILIRFHGE